MKRYWGPRLWVLGALKPVLGVFWGVVGWCFGVSGGFWGHLLWVLGYPSILWGGWLIVWRCLVAEKPDRVVVVVPRWVLENWGSKEEVAVLMESFDVRVSDG